MFGVVALAGLMLALPQITQAGTPPKIDSRYVINGGEVYDTKSDLTWQRCSVGLHWIEGLGCKGVAKKEFTFDEAQHQATKKWRIPNKVELSSLTVIKNKGPKIDLVAFPDMTEGMGYWTSQPLTSKLAWDIHFDDGEVYDTYRSDDRALRLVRSGR